MGVPFFVEEITGSGKLTTKDYMPTQVNIMPEICQHFNQFSRSGSGGSVIFWPPVFGSGLFFKGSKKFQKKFSTYKNLLI